MRQSVRPHPSKTDGAVGACIGVLYRNLYDLSCVARDLLRPTSPAFKQSRRHRNHKQFMIGKNVRGRHNKRFSNISIESAAPKDWSPPSLAVGAPVMGAFRRRDVETPAFGSTPRRLDDFQSSRSCAA